MTAPIYVGHRLIGHGSIPLFISRGGPRTGEVRTCPREPRLLPSGES
jgi:hypothetical protein